jgi:hypothetical protein
MMAAVASPPHREGCPCGEFAHQRCYPCRRDGEVLPNAVWRAMSEIYGDSHYRMSHLLELVKRGIAQAEASAQTALGKHYDDDEIGQEAIVDWATDSTYGPADLVAAVRHVEKNYDEDRPDPWPDCEPAYDEPECLIRPHPVCRHVECDRWAHHQRMQAAG